MLVSNLLKSCAILHMGKPISITKKSFSSKNIQIKPINSIKELQDPNKISLLLSFLSKLALDPDWIEYINLKDIQFEWLFLGEWKSSNPFFELHMRCMQRLIKTYHKVVSGYSKIETENLKCLVNAINFSFHETQKSQQVMLPFLIWPPSIHNHEYAYNDRGSYFIPFFGSHSFQIVIYLIVVETWMNILEEKIQKLIDSHDVSLLKGDITNLYEIITKVTQKCFDENNPWSKYQQFNDFYFFRYKVDNEYSDINRLYALARTLWSDELTYELKEYMKRIVMGFTSTVFIRIGKIIEIKEDNQTEICTKPIEFVMFGKNKDNLNTSMLSLSINKKPINEIQKFSTKMPKNWIVKKLAVEGKFDDDDDHGEKDDDDVMFQNDIITPCCQCFFFR